MSQIIDRQRERFKEAEWLSDTPLNITVVGAGGIGSWLTLLLSRSVNCNITLWDFDTVEFINTGCQFYGREDIGVPKVTAVADKIRDLSSQSIHPLCNKFTSDDFVSNYVFAVTDNMKSRKDAYKAWKESVSTGISSDYTGRCMFVDGRLLAEQFEIFFVQNNEEHDKKYTESLFEDSEVDSPPCGFKQTSHFAAMIAGKIVQGFTNYLSNVFMDEDVKEVPFHYEEIGPLFLNNTKTVEDE